MSILDFRFKIWTWTPFLDYWMNSTSELNNNVFYDVWLLVIRVYQSIKILLRKFNFWCTQILRIHLLQFSIHLGNYEANVKLFIIFILFLLRVDSELTVFEIILFFVIFHYLLLFLVRLVILLFFVLILVLLVILLLWIG